MTTALYIYKGTPLKMTKLIRILFISKNSACSIFCCALMAISYWIRSAFRIYILERIEEIDADAKFESVKSNRSMLFCS